MTEIKIKLELKQKAVKSTVAVTRAKAVINSNMKILDQLQRRVEARREVKGVEESTVAARAKVVINSNMIILDQLQRCVEARREVKGVEEEEVEVEAKRQKLMGQQWMRHFPWMKHGRIRKCHSVIADGAEVDAEFCVDETTRNS